MNNGYLTVMVSTINQISPYNIMPFISKNTFINQAQGIWYNAYAQINQIIQNNSPMVSITIYINGNITIGTLQDAELNINSVSL